MQCTSFFVFFFRLPLSSLLWLSPFCFSPLPKFPKATAYALKFFLFLLLFFFFFGILDLSLRLPYGDKSSGQVQSELKDPVTAGVCPAYFLCLPDGVFGFLVAYSDPLSCVWFLSLLVLRVCQLHALFFSYLVHIPLLVPSIDWARWLIVDKSSAVTFDLVRISN